MILINKNLTLESARLKFDEPARKFSGYASVFGGVDSYGDKIMPGAYKQTLIDRSRPVQLRWNHYGPVIGKFTSIYEDEIGLYVEGELTQGHSVAEDAYALLKHGAVDGLSIGYYVVKSERVGDINELHEIELIEISIVETPADLAAKIGDVKSAIEGAEKLKDLEKLLRDSGFSRSNATALVSSIKAMVRSEFDTEKEKAAEIAGIFQQFKNL